MRTITGIKDISPEDILANLKKMELDGKILNEKEIEVSVPITRSDILHQCDIAEDLAISYGYNNGNNNLTINYLICLEMKWPWVDMSNF